MKTCKACWPRTDDYDEGSCTNPHYARGFCKQHYRQDYRGRTIKPVTTSSVCRWPGGCGNRRVYRGYCPNHARVVESDMPGFLPCTVPSCDMNRYQGDLCAIHGQRFKRTGHTGTTRRYVNRRHDPHGYKTCTVCEKVLPHSEFYATPRSSDGLSGYCKLCQTAWNYNLTGEWIRDRRSEGCQLCGAHSQDLKLVIDHDHRCCGYDKSCGQCVRGLLCASCNSRGLAWYEAVRGTIEPIELFERYLQKYETPEQTLAAGVDRLDIQEVAA